MIKKLLLLALLLVLPLSAQIDTATGLSQPFDCGSPCAFGNYTVPAADTDQILILALTGRWSSSHDFSGVSCSVGGVNATFAVRAHLGSATSQTALFYILDADLPAPGARAVSCTHSSINTRSGMVRLQMLSGRVQSAPEQTNRLNATAATLSLDLTSVTANSVVVWAVGHDADPGDESPTADVDLGAVDGRYHESLAVLEATGGSVAVDPSWANSVVSHGVSASFAPQAADTTPPTPGAGVTISGATSSSLNVSVAAGTDDVTAQANLEYEFRRSLSSNMGSVANAEANGTIVRAYTANDVTHTDTGLTSGVTYFYQVIIKDEAENKAIHTTAKEAALVIGEAGVTHCRKCPGLYRVPDQILPEGQEEEVYTDTQLIILGGAEPRTWAIESGALPDGLSLSSAGVISGTVSAAEAGTHSFRVVVTEANGGKAKGNLSLVVNIAVGGGGALAFYEDAEDNDLTANPAWTAAGGCAATTTGVLEGSREVTKSSSTDCVLFDNVDEGQVYFGTDIEFTTPATARDEIIIGLGSSNEELFSCRFETDRDIFCKTPGQTGFELGGVPRGFYLGKAGTAAGEEAYLEIHYIAGTGTNATLEARLNGGAIQTFSAGTATANVDRIILRDDNDSAGDFVYDRIEAKDNDWPGRGPLTPPDPPPTPDPPGPWVTNFVPLRTHYVTQNGTGTETGADISNTEDFATALGHHTCGDLHVALAGTYSPPGGGNTLPLTYISQNCTESAPKVWKGYVDPATGQPDNVVWPFGILQPRRWHWFVGIHHNLSAVSPCAVSALESRHAGNRIINGVVHDARHQNLAFWRTAGTSEPGQMVYGTVSYSPNIIGCLTVVQPSHPFYGQNHFPTDGIKYIIQSIFVQPHIKGGRRVWQTNDTHGDRGISGWHLEKNFFGDANHDNEPGPAGSTPGAAVLNAYSAPNPWNDTFDQSDHMTLKDNFFVDFFHSPALRESVHASDHQQPWVGQVTGNYFARANFIAGGYWGSVDSPEQYVFTGNEIYDPPGGYHVKLETVIDNQEAGPRGGFKIPDQDIWNNNVYGGTFKARTWCNGTNFGDSTLAEWRTRTDGCRVTPASAVGFDIDSTNPANPTTDKVVVTVNEYQCPVGCPFTDQARGNIYAVNWDGNTTVSADISSVVGVGKTYVVRYATDFFGTAAASGTCPGSGACNVTLPSKRNNSDTAGRFSNYYVITGQP